MSSYEIHLPVLNLSMIKDIDQYAELYTDKPIKHDVVLIPGVSLLKGSIITSITWEANSKNVSLETGLCPDKYNLTVRYARED